jgi:hypothetical protein
MKGLPPVLLYLLIFGAVVAFNFLLQKAAKRQRAEAAKNAPIEQEIPEEEWNAAPAAVMVRPEPEEVIALRHRVAAPVAPAPKKPAGKRLRVARQSLFGERWDVQEAVVVATILGRCRADEPHEIR